MASRNQNRPPCSLSNKKPAAGTGRARTPLSVVVNNATASDAEGADSSTLEFTKEEVEALLNEKIKKGNPHDNKTKTDQNLDLITRLKLCVRALQSKVESAVKKCCDTEIEMKNKTEELNETISDLKKTVSSLEERNEKENSEKMEEIKKEREARITAEKIGDEKSAELEKVWGEKLAAEKKVISLEDMHKISQLYNMSLQEYSIRLQSEFKTADELRKQLEMEKVAIVESLSNTREHNKELQYRLRSLINGKEPLDKARHC